MTKIHDKEDPGDKKYVFNEDKIQPEDKDPEKSEDDDKKKKKKEDGPPPVSYFTLFRFSTTADKLLITIGCLCGFLSGFTNPLIIIFLGWMLDSFVKQQGGDLLCAKLNISQSLSENSSEMPTTEMYFNSTFIDPLEKFMEDCITFSMAMTGIAASQFVLSFIIVFTLSRAAENQAFRIRQAFMKAILRQDVGWFDTHQTGDFASRITADLGRIQDGIGEKFGICIFFYSTCIISLVVALVFGWKLTLVILSVMPVLVLATSVIAKIQAKVSGDELSAYGKAGAVAEEVISSIRTVASFGGEGKEIKRYEKELVTAKKNGIRRGLFNSIGMAIVWFCIYASYSLAFWYGTGLVLKSRCDSDPDYTPSKLIIVFFSVLTGAMFVGQTTPYMESFSMARGAAAKVFDVIERVPKIDSSSSDGERPSLLIGRVCFRDVHFKYPARADVPVLQGLSLDAVPGETVALVGSSGCGKSTVIQLLQRFYDTEEGQVLLDGKDIRELNVGWLRDNMGVVGQEPVLFATSIAENIRYGRTEANEEDVIKAAQAANAHDFIMKLPQNYKTVIGERGTQLSGGQKQRIAIARALVRNPRILLLDEATSALDTESESVVQAALDEARIGRTTLVVAHRLSTIRTANKIVAIEKGQVKEVGTHDELMEKKGLYYQLVTTQQSALQAAQNENFDENDEDAEDQKIREELANRKNLERHLSISSTVSNGSTGSFSHSVALRTYSSIRRKHGEAGLELGKKQSVDIKEEDEEEANANPSKYRLLKMTTPEWPYVLVGCISSLLMGLSIPIYGIFFGDILGALSKEDDEARRETNMYCLIFVGMGVASAIASFLQSFMFSVVAERLTLRLRKEVFTMMVTQEMSWFDDPSNATGALCSRLSTDASQVQGAGGSRMSTILQSLSTLATAIVIGFIYNWKIGLVVLSFIPLVLASTYFETRVTSGHLLSEKAAFEKATKVAVEAIENVRTVASLHLEQLFFKHYVDALDVPHRMSRKKSFMRGFTFGISQCIPNMAYAVSMYYGSVLISKGELTYDDLFKVLESIILGCMMIGQAVAFAPDYQRAKISAVRIFKLLDKQSLINPFSTAGKRPEFSQGDLVLRGVHFSYPTRSQVQVLRGLSFSAKPGQTVALVGSSGCGKSTCIQLLERFYDAPTGELLLDGTDVKELNLAWLRSQVGLVSQEPVLFSYSIAENIAYGDNNRKVPMEEIIEAARKANIHGFVEALPTGYDTNVGDRGTQLSGGQKQRIAIARALIRNPNILLLDEATSALDTESEKVVQEALDKAREGRTCIVIAHRLTTVQNADEIVVIHKGKIVEKGTHHELLAKQGFYFKLHSIQAGKT